jgi:hypothetical protein
MVSLLEDFSHVIFRMYRDSRERSHPVYQKIVPLLLKEAFSENTPKSYIKQGEVHDWLKTLLD